MSDRTCFTQTTAEITIDTPAAVCISIALDRELDALDRRLARASNPAKIESLQATRANVEAAKAAFDPVYSRVLAQRLYTPEHEAEIDAALRHHLDRHMA